MQQKKRVELGSSLRLSEKIGILTFACSSFLALVLGLVSLIKLSMMSEFEGKTETYIFLSLGVIIIAVLSIFVGTIVFFLKKNYRRKATKSIFLTLIGIQIVILGLSTAIAITVSVSPILIALIFHLSANILGAIFIIHRIGLSKLQDLGTSSKTLQDINNTSVWHFKREDHIDTPSLKQKHHYNFSSKHTEEDDDFDWKPHSDIHRQSDFESDIPELKA